MQLLNYTIKKKNKEKKGVSLRERHPVRTRHMNEDHQQRPLLTRQLSKDISSSTTTATTTNITTTTITITTTITTTTTTTTTTINPVIAPSSASVMMSKPVGPLGPNRPLLRPLQEKQQSVGAGMLVTNTMSTSSSGISSGNQHQQHQEVCGVQGAASRQLTTTSTPPCPSPPESARQTQSSTSSSPSRPSSSQCRDSGDGHPPTPQQQQQRLVAAPSAINSSDQQIRVLTPSEIMRTLPSLSQEHYDPPPPPAASAIVVVPPPPTSVHHHHHYHPSNAMVRANFCPSTLLVSFSSFCVFLCPIFDRDLVRFIYIDSTDKNDIVNAFLNIFLITIFSIAVTAISLYNTYIFQKNNLLILITIIIHVVFIY